MRAPGSNRSVSGTVGLATLTCACFVVALAANTGTTAAAFSDFDGFTNRASAGVWAPDPPTACTEIMSKAHATIEWGTPGPDIFYGGNHPQVYMGMDGDDEVHGNTQEDCLVGGAGDDAIFGDQAKDILLGGPGNDFIDGGNAPDTIDGGVDDDSIDGGNGPDTCIGGGGVDTITNCEPAPPAPAAMLASQLSEPTTAADSDGSATDGTQIPIPEEEIESAHGPTADDTATKDVEREPSLEPNELASPSAGSSAEASPSPSAAGPGTTSISEPAGQ